MERTPRLFSKHPRLTLPNGGRIGQSWRLCSSNTRCRTHQGWLTVLSPARRDRLVPWRPSMAPAHSTPLPNGQPAALPGHSPALILLFIFDVGAGVPATLQQGLSRPVWSTPAWLGMCLGRGGLGGTPSLTSVALKNRQKGASARFLPPDYHYYYMGGTRSLGP